MKTIILRPELVKTIYDDRGEPFAEIVRPVLPVSDLMKFRNVKMAMYLDTLREWVPGEESHEERSCR